MRHSAQFRDNEPARGFTLIEVMITVVIVAVLASIAFPNFMDAVRKSRRSEAFTALSNVQQTQERWRANNQTYSADLTTAWPNGLGIPSTTPGGYYTIAVAVPAGDDGRVRHEAVATAVSGTTQASDGDCAKLGVRMAAGVLTYAGTTAGGTLAYTNTHKCWSR